MAREIEQAFDTGVPERSYTLQLSDTGRIEWHSTHTTPPTVLTTEPGSSWWSRAGLVFLSWLPIDWLL